MAFVPVTSRLFNKGQVGKQYNGFWCNHCGCEIKRWNAHLPHCTDCGEHHAKTLTCEESARYAAADQKMGDPNP